MNRLATVLSFATALACQPADGPADDLGEDERLDAQDVRVLELSVGEGVSGLRVEAIPNGVPNPSREQMARATFIVQTRVTRGQTVAITAHGEQGPVDPYLILYDEDNNAVARADDQALITSRSTDDALLAYHSDLEQVLRVVVTGGEFMHTSGVLGVDIVPLGADPGDSLTASTLRVRRRLRAVRDSEAESQALVAEGAAIELPTGLLGENLNRPDDSPYSRPELLSILNRLNSPRQRLFDAYSEISGTSAEAIGMACAELWEALPASR